MVEQVACNSDFLASFPLYYRDSPERKKKKKTSLEEKALVAYDTYERRRERGRRRSNVTRSHRRAKTGNESEGKREREKKVYFALSWHRQCARKKRRRAARCVYIYEEETVNHGREEIERERENKGTRVHTRHVRT